MFTGIIQSFGSIDHIDSKTNIFKIKTNLDLNNCNEGSSICCDGVCLTIFNILKSNSEFIFSVNIGEETYKRSNLSNWKKGNKINLEKSLRVGDEISGHFVYGHIDTTAYLKKIYSFPNSWEFEFSLAEVKKSSDLIKFIVEKGSISINGISLTVSSVINDFFKVSIIPHTFQNTNLSILKINDKVNIEFDPFARYLIKYEK